MATQDLYQSIAKDYLLSKQRCTVLEIAAQDRKHRLAALKNRTEGSGESILKFRNYDPTSREPKKSSDEIDNLDTVEYAVKGLAESILAKDEELRNEELDVFNIAPKRPNWDLKREISKKMHLLNKADQLAINTLLRQRLSKPDSNGQELASATNKPTGLINYADDDDD
ncbi:hypothetical protein E3Q02_00207 [Wallemia mellicola]|uniref:mRNA splicing factor n=1 Tax=Wallemia mellicola TaxID=1708541 RepID=A0AB38N3S1_9BASI|nr:hypothetical protein E3Q02_00207 [Wallemia mellicola]